MERFWCYVTGFCIAILLVIAFTIVKDVVEERKEASEHRLKARMQSVFWS